MEIIHPYAYEGWSNCVYLSNGIINLIATTDIGPRIIHFGFMDDQNEFKEIKETLGQTGGENWKNYGGHRLWFAPEHPILTYHPDNTMIRFHNYAEFIRLSPPKESTSGIQKEIDIYLSKSLPQVKVIHRLFNYNLWPIELAPWAISVMAPGGLAIAPLPPRGEHPDELLPVNSLSMWAYTDMSDPRWIWGHRYILLKQDPTCGAPQKAGLLSTEGWVAYANNGHLFVKFFDPELEFLHPDNNSNIEFFTNQEILEVETLGALITLEPENSVEYIETWYLFKDIIQPKDEAGVMEAVVPIIENILNQNEF